MGIEDLPLDDLLADLDKPQPVSRLEVVARWLEESGIYPGSTKILANELYQEFLDWCADNRGTIEKIPSLASWGRQMTYRIKKTRGKKGYQYWISRSKEPKIPENLGYS